MKGNTGSGLVLAWTVLACVICGAGPIESWQDDHDRGWRAFEEGRLAEAVPLLTSAAGQARALGADARTAMAYDHLAWALAAQGRFSEAEPLAKWALQCRMKRLGAGHHEVAQSYNTVAVLADSQKHYGEAEAAFRQALAIEEKSPRGEGPANIAALLDNLATVCHCQGKLTEAAGFYQRALDLREQAGKPEELAPTLHNLAALAEEQGKLDEAERLHRRALEIQEQALGKDHPDRATSLHGLARVQHKRKRYDEANALYGQARTILEEKLGPNHILLAPLLEDQSETLRETGQMDAAKALKDRAEKVRADAAEKPTRQPD